MAPAVNDALDSWLRTNTWCKNHSLDTARFFEVVLAAWSESQKLWDEGEIRNSIVAKATNFHGKQASDLAHEVATERLTQGTLILEFLLYMKGR
jgi:hypothetical protein